jgi:hypothetical protein
MPDEIKIAELLGRPLSSTEEDNFELYLDIVKERLKKLLGYDVSYSAEATLKYDARIGYHTLYVNPYTAITRIQIDGNEIEGFTMRQWDDLNADWFNAITFHTQMKKSLIEVTATYGFGAELPSDLSYLIAQLFNVVSQEQVTDGRVEQKSIEGYSIKYKDTSNFKEFSHDNQSTISKYSILVGEVHSPEVLNERIYQLF